MQQYNSETMGEIEALTRKSIADLEAMVDEYESDIAKNYGNQFAKIVVSVAKSYMFLGDLKAMMDEGNFGSSQKQAVHHMTTYTLAMWSELASGLAKIEMKGVEKMMELGDQLYEMIMQARANTHQKIENAILQNHNVSKVKH